MGKLEKYSSYKDSGVVWLGEIPDHWATQKMKYLGKMFAGLTDKKGDDFAKEISEDKMPFIPFTNVCNNLKIDKNQMQYVKIKPYEKQNKVQKNDIIFLMSSETLDDIGKCSIYLDEEQFYLNSFCKGFRPKTFAVYAEFLNFLLQSKTYRNYFALVGRGFTRINIKQEYINDLFTVLPPKEEQIKISSFLDKKTAQIDEVISQKEKLIELLKERKQIVINDAVTKGLDKNVEFVDSGIEWIGVIPKHWEIEKGKRLFQQMKRPVRDTDEIVTCFRDGEVTLRTNRRTDGFTNALKEHGYQGIRKGDFVIHNMDAFAGAIGISDSDGKSTPVYSVCRPWDESMVFSEYYAKYLRNLALQDFILSLAKGIRERSTDFRFKDFGELEYPLPPKDEQLQIVEYIETQTAKIDNAIALQQNYISKLKEYKSSLIDSVVTGKVKVG